MVLTLDAGWKGWAARFRREAEDSAGLSELGALFTREVEGFGVTAYAMGQMGCGNHPTLMLLNTWPRAWVEYYAANGFVREDPAVAEAIASDEPFTWGELGRRRDLAGNRVMAAARAHGFADGFVMPVRHGAARGLVALAGRRLGLDADNRQALQDACLTCYRVAHRLYHMPRAPLPALTPRERAALALVARGLDDAAIGEALGVARNSAHAYVERAKRRLGAGTRAQAVAIALAEGLL